MGEEGRDEFVEMESEAFRIILGDYVTTEDGTGIVHIAPTFGADDAKVARMRIFLRYISSRRRGKHALWSTSKVSITPLMSLIRTS